MVRHISRKILRQAFSLVELLVVVAVMGIMTALVLPSFQHPVRDSQFNAFAAELTSNLILARRYAQMSGHSVFLEFAETDEYRYRCVSGGPGLGDVVLSVDPWDDEKTIRNQLPQFRLTHPVNQRELDRALASTHAPKVVFAPKGSSNATIVFSDGTHRAICAIVSGQSGRFRVFLWDNTSRVWLDYY